jgi:3alpha(or 20beta)-hydroxysteroid dehydrogenase
MFAHRTFERNTHTKVRIALKGSPIVLFCTLAPVPGGDAPLYFMGAPSLSFSENCPTEHSNSVFRQRSIGGEVDEAEHARASIAVPTEFASRRFLVTGGARGIGAAVVNRLAGLGASGLIVDLAVDPAESALWPAVAVDITDEVALRQAIHADIKQHGPFNGLVAAAGIVPGWHSPIDVDLEMLNQTLAVNLTGFVASMKYVAHDMPRGSSIVAIGSLNSWRGDPNLLAYAASKHAVLGAVRSAAQSLGGRGIRVNAVAPGPVATDALLSRIESRVERTGMSQADALHAAQQLTALGALATPDDITDAVVFLSGSSSAAITGQILAVDGGLL